MAEQAQTSNDDTAATQPGALKIAQLKASTCVAGTQDLEERMCSEGMEREAGGGLGGGVGGGAG